MLVIYDNTGKIFMMGNGYDTPDGINYMDADEVQNQYIVSIDTSVTPHKPVYKEYPKSEMQLLKEENEKQQADLDYLMLITDSAL